MTFDLRHSDAFDVLPGFVPVSVDHVITDPPYSEHVHQRVRTSSAKLNDAAYGSTRRASIANTKRAVDLGFDHLTPEFVTEASQHFARITRKWVLVFCDIEAAPEWRDALRNAGLDYVRTGIWLKPGAAPQFSGDRPGVGYESIVIAHQPGRKRWNGGGKHAIWTHPIVLDRAHTGQRVHTAQKPLGLMAALVVDFTNPGETILDPFAGSGTTGVAALMESRRFIGVERDAAHYAMALHRLTSAAAQPRLIEALEATA